MSDSRIFSAINTKIDALASKLLKDGDYIELLKKRTSKNQITYLSKIEKFNGFVKENEDIYFTELNLLRYRIHEMEKLKYFFNDEYKKFYEALMLQFKIRDVKIILRKLQLGERLNFIENDLLVFEEKEIEKIKNINSIKSFINFLEPTVFYRTLKPFENEKEESILFYMEMNLDNLFYTNIQKAIENLSSEDQGFAKELLGRKIDMLNITWIYRGLKFYSLLPEELINFSVPGGYILNYKKIKEMCYSKNIQELIDFVSKTQYSFLFDTSGDVDLYMDRRMARFIYYKSLKDFRKSNNDIRKFISYYYLLESEIRDIITILESNRFELSGEATSKYIIRKLEGSDVAWL